MLNNRFYRSNFPCTIEVKVIFNQNGNDFIFDEIKGLKKKHALENAIWNWPDAIAILFLRVVEEVNSLC